jgi:hypothetical protein
MFGSPVRTPAETVVADLPQPLEMDLVTLAELAAEGFGYGAPFVASPLDAIAALAGQLGGAVELDDLGRQCVSREVARSLFAERAESERRQREAQKRLEAEYVERGAANRPWTGIPADRVPDGVSPAGAMLQAGKDAQPRRRSVLEHALANDGTIEFHPLPSVEP